MTLNRTAIQWTDYTANPIAFKDAAGKRVWACEKVSAGCANCYASALNNRHHGSHFTVNWMASVTPHLFENTLHSMLTFKPKPPFRNPSGRPMVFVGDMTDVFGAWMPDEMLDRMFAVFALRPDVDWQVLTKRPERMREYLTLLRPGRSADDVDARVLDAAFDMDFTRTAKLWDLRDLPWPLPNCWLGTSVENQQAADERIPHLLATPAAVRFLSCEPLLGPVDISAFLSPPCTCVQQWDASTLHAIGCDRDVAMRRRRWIIAGGESGPGARPCDLAWMRSLRDQCAAADVPYFNKQLGARPVLSAHARDETGPISIQQIYPGFGRKLRDRHGGRPEEWPEDLRRREFPGLEG